MMREAVAISAFVIDDFSPARGETFELDLGGTRIGLTLDEVQELPGSMRESGSFRLEFHGPSEPLLPQATYRLERGGEAYDIFMVPISRDDEKSTYEAIFN